MDQDGWRMPAHKLELAGRDCLLSFLSDKVAVLKAMNRHDGNYSASANSMNQILKSANELIETIQSSSQLESLYEVRSVVARVELGQSTLRMTVRLSMLLPQGEGEVACEGSKRSGSINQMM